MWSSIPLFYSSTEWNNLRLSIIMDRTNEQGQVICEHCGQPIIKKYDLIAHHIIELTPVNVNDYNISLNPDNIMLVHHSCHNAIHNRMEYKQKKVYLVVGSTCSGKSSWAKKVAGRNDVIHDMDELWKAISNNDMYYKPNSLKNMVMRLRDTMLEQILMRNFEGNAYVLSTEARLRPRERLAQRIGADEIIYIECTKEEALERLYADPLRQPYIKEQEQYINDFFDKLQL